MSEQPLDAQGEARDALSSVVADFGPRVLSDPRMLGSRMSDLLPDLPKERQLLLTAAEADVAGELRRHVQEQHLDPNTAVQLVARSLTDRKSIDPTSSMWVATQYAQALGYPVQPGAMPPPVRPTPPPQPQPPPFGQPTVTTYGYQDPTIGASGGYGGYVQPQPPSGGGGYGQPQPPSGGGGYGQPQPPSGGGGYGQPQPPSGGGGYYPPQSAGGQAPPTGSPSQGTPGWYQPPIQKPPRKRGLIYGLGAAAAAVVIIVGVGFGTHWFGGTPKPKPSPSLTTHTTRPAPSPTGPTLAAGVAPLVQLLPADVNVANCNTPSKAGWATPGLVKALSCYDSGLSDSGDTIYAYQMDNTADYQSSWSNFTSFAGYNPNASSGCPPSGSATIGQSTWDDSGSKDWFPAATGQIILCGPLLNGKNQQVPGYAYSFPSEDAYIIAIGSPTTAYSTLDKWWVDNSEPAASPKPATP